MLPDDVLLAIFYFRADENQNTKEEIEEWQTLVHVCRRWRSLVFGSPRRLNLRLVCTSRTRARDTLNAWPALPLFVWCYSRYLGSVDNLVAVLARTNCVFQIDLRHISSSYFEGVLAAMQGPFPELRHLVLSSHDKAVPVLPDSFLGGSTPHLIDLELNGIPFPGLPTLLVSASHLVHLILYDIPHSGYFSPEAIVTALSSLFKLRTLRVEFQSPRSCPDQASRRPPSQTRFRVVFPVLSYFWFKGVCEYLEDIVARIDAPQLIKLYITFFNQIVFDTPRFIQFIGRTPGLEALKGATLTFQDGTASINLTSPASPGIYFEPELNVSIRCRELDWQVSSLEQVCTWCLPPLSALEDLYISEEPYWQSYWQDNIETMLWLELLHPFTAVKNLYLSEEVARRIVPALQELDGGRTTEVLPILQNIFLAGLEPLGPVQEGIWRFVSTRQVTGHPLAVSHWDRIPQAPREEPFILRLEPLGPVQEGIGRFVSTRQVTGHPLAVSYWDRIPQAPREEPFSSLGPRDISLDEQSPWIMF